MTRDDIIRMAREAELGVVLTADESVDGEGGVWLDADVNYITQIERFFHAAYTAGAAAERKACKKACKLLETCRRSRSAPSARGKK